MASQSTMDKLHDMRLSVMARAYRDLSGLANQMAGAAADEVYLVACGLAVNIRRLAENWED